MNYERRSGRQMTKASGLFYSALIWFFITFGVFAVIFLTSCASRSVPLTYYEIKEGPGWTARIFPNGKILLLSSNDQVEYTAMKELCAGFICVGPEFIGTTVEIERIKK